MALEKWHPLKELEVMRREMDRLWDEFLPSPRKTLFSAPWKRLGTEEGIAVPAVDVIDKKDEVLVKAELPGIDKDKLDITIEDDNLLIRGEVKKEEEVKEENYYHWERRYRSFARSVAIPKKIDAAKVKASFKDGIVEVHLPKSEELKPKKVKIDVK